MLTFFEIIRYKLNCTLASVEGKPPPNHPLSNKIEHHTDRQVRRLWLVEFDHVNHQHLGKRFLKNGSSCLNLSENFQGINYSILKLRPGEGEEKMKNYQNSQYKEKSRAKPKSNLLFPYCVFSAPVLANKLKVSSYHVNIDSPILIIKIFVHDLLVKSESKIAVKSLLKDKNNNKNS